LRVLRGHFDRIERVSSCAANERIVSADEAGEVCEFDVTDGRLLERWVIHENRVRSVAMWGTGGWVSAGDDGRVMVREWAKTAPTQRAWLNTAIYGLLGPLADRRWVALGADGSVSALDMESGSLTTLIEDQVYLRTQDISPCGRRLACGGKSGVLRLWQYEDPTQARAVEIGESILELRWLSSTTIVGCGRNGMVFSAHLLPQGDWQVDRHFSYTDHVFALAADVRALRFYTAGFDGRVICWAALDDSVERGA
jgi:WD40 repeat protein